MKKKTIINAIVIIVLILTGWVGWIEFRPMSADFWYSNVENAMIDGEKTDTTISFHPECRDENFIIEMPWWSKITFTEKSTITIKLSRGSHTSIEPMPPGFFKFYKNGTSDYRFPDRCFPPMTVNSNGKSFCIIKGKVEEFDKCE